MQKMQTELQVNRKCGLESKISNKIVRDTEMSQTREMEHSVLKWEDIAGLFWNDIEWEV